MKRTIHNEIIVNDDADIPWSCFTSYMTSQRDRSKWWMSFRQNANLHNIKLNLVFQFHQWSSASVLRGQELKGESLPKASFEWLDGSWKGRKCISTDFVCFSLLNKTVLEQKSTDRWNWISAMKGERGCFWRVVPAVVLETLGRNLDEWSHERAE